MTEDTKRPKRKAQSNTTAVSFNVWTMDGQRLPDAVIELLDKALQRAMDQSRVRLAASLVRG